MTLDTLAWRHGSVWVSSTGGEQRGEVRRAGLKEQGWKKRFPGEMPVELDSNE